MIIMIIVITINTCDGDGNVGDGDVGDVGDGDGGDGDAKKWLLMKKKFP